MRKLIQITIPRTEPQWGQIPTGLSDASPVIVFAMIMALKDDEKQNGFQYGRLLPCSGDTKLCSLNVHYAHTAVSLSHAHVFKSSLNEQV